MAGRRTSERRSNPALRIDSRRLPRFFLEHQSLQHILIPSLLVLSIIAAYHGVLDHEFIGIDDGAYVFKNEDVSGGLTAKSFAWAFKSLYAGNWHPLTWLSHMLDCQLFGLDPGLHHLGNLLLHIANTILLYLVLKRLTTHVWRSALVAALFALHPLRVESVAWVAERKDLLSGLFFMLTIAAYVSYVKLRSQWRYALILISLTAGLLAKPMLVTVPFVMILLDFWPLSRLRLDKWPGIRGLFRGIWPLVAEKLPLFSLTAASCVVTYVAQARGGAITSFTQLPLLQRIASSMTSYLTYIQLMFWPLNLGILYPYNETVSPWRAILSLVILSGVTGLFMWQASSRGYLLAGWLWYLGMLFPVIGIVQIGAQAYADRYTYLPMVGLFLILAWGLGDFVKERPSSVPIVCAFASFAIALLGFRTFVQVGYWQNNLTLYKHTLEVAPDNPIILLNLGAEYADRHLFDEAKMCYENALRFSPNSAQVHAGLGVVLAQSGDKGPAMQHLLEALRIDPSLSFAYHALGVLLLSENRTNDGISYLREAVRLDPKYSDAHNSLGAALLLKGSVSAAIEEFNEALKLRPDFPDAQRNLRTALSTRRPQGK